MNSDKSLSSLEMGSQGVTALVQEIRNDVNALKSSEVWDPQQLWRRVQKTEQGVVLHRVFEALRYHGIDGVRKLVEKSFESDESKSDSIMQALNFVVQLQEPPMVELLKNGFAEWGFNVRRAETMGGLRNLRGQIDLWGYVDDAIWIVDYKTGNIYPEKAFLQLELYAEALIAAEKIKPNSPIFLSVIQPFSQTVQVRKRNKN